MKDNKYYLWGSEEQTGIVMNMEGFKDVKMGEREINSIDDVISVLEEKKNNCKLSPESASMMEVPKDVVFEDVSGFLEGAKKQE